MGTYERVQRHSKSAPSTTIPQSTQLARVFPSASTSIPVHHNAQTQSGHAAGLGHSIANVQVSPQGTPGDPEYLDHQLRHRIQASKGRGLSLDVRSKNILKSSLVLDTSSIRLHTDAEADSLSRTINATAFTAGTDIFFRSGMYRPDSRRGLHLLAHEAAHVAQQVAGPVAGTPIEGGISISDPKDHFEQVAAATANQVIARADFPRTASVHQMRPAASTLAMHVRAATAPQNHIAIQRSIGLEMELAVPVDQCGKLSADEQQQLASTNPDQEKIKSIKKRAPLKPKQLIKQGKGFKAVADKGTEVGILSIKKPPKTLGSSIIELVTDPPVSRERALGEAIDACIKYCEELNGLTHGLTRRVSIGKGLYAGPINSEDQKPADLGFQAGIQVNLGIDPRKFHELLDWYLTSEYEPGKTTKNAELGKRKHEEMQIALNTGKELADMLRKQSTPEQLKLAHNFDGVQSLATVLALYLRSGNYEEEVTVVKNFTPILLKTSLAYAFNDLTHTERQVLEKYWNEFQKYLIGKTRGNSPEEQDPKQLLIKSTLKSGQPASAHTIDYLFKSVRDLEKPPIAVGGSSEIEPDPVGPLRHIRDDTLPKDEGGELLHKKYLREAARFRTVQHPGTITGRLQATRRRRALAEFRALRRRRAVVGEFRAIPGRYMPNQWFTIGKTFLAAAENINMGE